MFAYAGLRQILDFGGEAVNPQRNIPIAIVVGGLLIPLVIYLVLQVGFIGAVNWDAGNVAPGDWQGLLGSSWASAPLLNAISAAGFAWFSIVLLSDATISPAATGWVWLGIGARSTYSMSVNGELPQAFQRINRFGTPIVALAACTGLGFLFFFPSPSWYSFVSQVSIALTLSCLMGGPVLVVLRRTAPDFPRPFRLKMPTFWAIAGYVASLLLIYFAGWVPLINLFTVVFFALPLYGAYASVRNGWSRKLPSWVLSGLYTSAWVIVAAQGGWMFTRDQEQASDGLPFEVYYTAMVSTVAIFLVGLYIASNAKGRRNIRGGVWIVATFLATLFVAYQGQFGPLETPALGNQSDILLMAVIAVGSFFWSVRSGGPTEELAALLAAEVPASDDKVLTH